MMIHPEEIFEREMPQHSVLASLIDAQDAEQQQLFNYAAQVRAEHVGPEVYFRGLIEYSNRCTKNCYYCGVRGGNARVHRYACSDQEVIEAARFAMDNHYASLVLQSGERMDLAFTNQIARLLDKIHRATGGKMHITLSMGEQTRETYRRWRECGAHRYLLRIEASNRELFEKIHPVNCTHSFDRRMEALLQLRDTGYQVGSGVMIGLPFQTTDDLANDLLFFREMDLDMVGMGPYIEHERTPLWQYRHLLPSSDVRLSRTMNMVALLRIIMKDINIAATTAMQTLHPQGRTMALKVGANVMMPNITPLRYREDYLLYANKPGVKENPEDSRDNLMRIVEEAGMKMALGVWGDSRHYAERSEKK